MADSLIAIDAGTTGVTGVLYDTQLRPLAREAREFPQLFPQSGWVEHRGEDILAALDEVLTALLARSEARDVVGLGVTNQRETIFALERASGRALGTGIVWQDRRTADRCAELRAAGHSATVLERTGLVLDPYFSATKIEWMLAHDADLERRTRAGEVWFATVDALVVAHLTGNRVQATDPTNASRTMLFDTASGSWSPELCGLFGVRPEWLPEVRPPVGDFGSTDPGRCAGRSLPIRGVAGDQQAALFGQGCFDAGSLKITLGTGAFLLLNMGQERRLSQRGLLATLAVGRRGETVHALEGSAFVCGALVQWLRDSLGLIDRAADVERLAAGVPDAGGVVCVPALAGLGAPHWDPGARGALFGLTRGTTAAHVARAALEAMALQNTELVEVLREDTGLAIEELLVDGGAAQNDLLMQLQADSSGARVHRPPSVEATARGAALMAGLGLGLWADPSEPAALQEAGQVFAPGWSAEQRALRLGAYRDAVGRVRTTGV